jgi:hypothetical protein
MTPDESGQEMNQAHVGTTHGGCLTLGPQGPFPLLIKKTKQNKNSKGFFLWCVMETGIYSLTNESQ